jgi:hypothetical protein
VSIGTEDDPAVATIRIDGTGDTQRPRRTPHGRGDISSGGPGRSRHAINNGFRHRRTVATDAGDAASVNHLMQYGAFKLVTVRGQEVRAAR